MNPKILKMLLCLGLLTISYNVLNAQNFTKKIKVAGFRKVEVENGISVIMQQTNNEHIEIKGNKELVNNVEVKLEADGTLQIGFKENMFQALMSTNKNVKVYLSFVQLEKLSVNNGSSVSTNSTLLFDDIKIKVSDGSALKLHLVSNKLHIHAVDGSSALLSGRTKFLNIIAHDGSSVNAENLESKDVTLNANDGSSLTVFSTNKLVAKANEGSAIMYKGYPTSKDFHASESSSISKK